MLTFEALHKQGKMINTSKMSDEVFHEWCDQTVRIIFCKYREIKNDSKALARVYKRCTPKQQTAIAQVLSKISINQDIVDSKTDKCLTLSPPKSWGSWPSNASIGSVDGEPPSTQSIVLHPAATTSQTDQDPFASFSSVFKQVLAGTNSIEGVGSKQEAHTEATLSHTSNAKAEASTTTLTNIFCGKWKMADQTPPGATTPTSPPLDMNLDESEQQMIKFASQEAANATTQNTIKSQPPHKSKAKSKAKCKAKSKAKHVKATHTKKAVSSDQPDRKTLFKRFTSSAYHKAMKDAKQKGLDEGEAKEIARMAYKKAADDFEKST
jgi:hypothetical protein